MEFSSVEVTFGWKYLQLKISSIYKQIKCKYQKLLKLAKCLAKCVRYDYRKSHATKSFFFFFFFLHVILFARRRSWLHSSFHWTTSHQDYVHGSNPEWERERERDRRGHERIYNSTFHGCSRMVTDKRTADFNPFLLPLSVDIERTSERFLPERVGCLKEGQNFIQVQWNSVPFIYIS